MKIISHVQKKTPDDVILAWQEQQNEKNWKISLDALKGNVNIFKELLTIY